MSSIEGIGIAALLQMAQRMSGAASVDGTEQTSATSESRPTGQTQGPPPPPPDSDISELSDLLSKLENLKTSDPEKYEEILTDVANRIRELAGRLSEEDVSGTEDADAIVKMLNEIADRFEKAASTGDVSSLLPSPPSGPPPAAANGEGNVEGYAQYASQQEPTTIGSDVFSQLMEIFNDFSARLG
ncbi:hypothetical protein JW916_03255 [Candidatus Sumerlaeota bacterium]|nr:hypothetical protein [Candidatus Sumerlaeota bacterium]